MFLQRFSKRRWMSRRGGRTAGARLAQAGGRLRTGAGFASREVDERCGWGGGGSEKMIGGEIGGEGIASARLASSGEWFWWRVVGRVWVGSVVVSGFGGEWWGGFGWGVYKAPTSEPPPWSIRCCGVVDVGNPEELCHSPRHPVSHANPIDTPSRESPRDSGVDSERPQMAVRLIPSRLQTLASGPFHSSPRTLNARPPQPPAARDLRGTTHLHFLKLATDPLWNCDASFEKARCQTA